jgi:hypothetical protein
LVEGGGVEAVKLTSVFKKIQLLHWKRKYSVGQITTRFIAPDIRRDVEVVDVLKA